MWVWQYIVTVVQQFHANEKLQKKYCEQTLHHLHNPCATNCTTTVCCTASLIEQECMEYYVQYSLKPDMNLLCFCSYTCLSAKRTHSSLQPDVLLQINDHAMYWRTAFQAHPKWVWNPPPLQGHKSLICCRNSGVWIAVLVEVLRGVLVSGLDNWVGGGDSSCGSACYFYGCKAQLKHLDGLIDAADHDYHRRAAKEWRIHDSLSVVSVDQLPLQHEAVTTLAWGPRRWLGTFPILANMFHLPAICVAKCFAWSLELDVQRLYSSASHEPIVTRRFLVVIRRLNRRFFFQHCSGL